MYEAFYQLSTVPFRLTPDPDFCFRHHSYTEAWAYLRYALKQGEGFIVITGRPGIGKTTLINAFLREIGPSGMVATSIAAANVDAADLMRAVAYAWGINVEGLDKITTVHRIRQFLQQHRQQGKRALLIVDEAQGLGCAALEELRLLADLQAGSSPLLQVFLVGQERLRDLMTDPALDQLQQRVIGTCFLEPLDVRETRAYMEHRLQRAGWHGDPELTGGALLSIYEYSGGVPRYINKIGNRLFLYGSLNRKHVLDQDDVLTIIDELKTEQLVPIEESVGPPASVPELEDGSLSLDELALLRPPPRVAAPEPAPAKPVPPPREQAPPPPSESPRIRREPVTAPASPQHPPVPETARRPWPRSAVILVAVLVSVLAVTMYRQPEPEDALPALEEPYTELLSEKTDTSRRLVSMVRVGDAGPATPATPPVAAVDPGGQRSAASAPDVTAAAVPEPVRPSEPEPPLVPATEPAPPLPEPVAGPQAAPEPAGAAVPVEVASPSVDTTETQRAATAAEAVTQSPADPVPPAAQQSATRAESGGEETAPVEAVRVASVTEPAVTGALPLGEIPEAGDVSSGREEIARWLQRADRSLARNRLLTPASDSAYGWYRRVLDLEPDNPQAQHGMDRIVGRYVVLARQALSHNDEARADRYIQRGLSVNPQDRRLLVMRRNMLIAAEARRQQEAAVVTPPAQVPVVDRTGEGDIVRRLKEFFDRDKAQVEIWEDEQDW